MFRINTVEPIFTWCYLTLEKQGYQIQGPVEPVRLMPWSQVYRVNTDKGYVFLKHLTEPFAIETKVIQYLSQNHSELVPKLLAYDDQLRCFLMQDAGLVLRAVLKKRYDAKLASQAIVHYAAIQIAMKDHIQPLLSYGVPDWRLDQLPNLFKRILSWHSLLRQDGLTQSEFQKLQALLPQFEDLCQCLSKYHIPETIEHCDFQDNNILVQENTLIINDWGDSVISHPFFSLISFLRSAARNHLLSEKSEVLHFLKISYLRTWLDYGSQDKLLEAFEIAKCIHPIKFVASFYRVSLCPGMENLGVYQGTMKEAIIDFINMMENNA